MMKLQVDDAKITAFIAPFILFIGLYADIALSVWLAIHSTTHSKSMLTTVAAISLVVSYLANIGMMVTVLLRMMEDKMTSIYTKRYFQEYSQIYIAMVFASGDCFIPLWLITSNLFGAPLLNSGLSYGQREKYRVHHLICVILLRNIPLFIIQCHLLADALYSIVILADFITTTFSITVCAVAMLNFRVINKRNIELPFTIKLQWNSKGETATNTMNGMNGDHDIEDAMRSVTAGGTSFDRIDSVSSSNPMSRIGRRRRLAEELSLRVKSIMDLEGPTQFKVEVMSATRHHSSVLMHAVLCGTGPDRDETERLVRETVDGLECQEMLRVMVYNAVQAAFSLDDQEFGDYKFTVSAWKHSYEVPTSTAVQDMEVANNTKRAFFPKDMELNPTESVVVDVLEKQNTERNEAGAHEIRMSTAL